MRTREARRVKKDALKRARIYGHNPELISGEGAMHLYGCLEQGCFHLLECWDYPTHASGLMMHSPCADALKRSWWKRMRHSIYEFIWFVTE